MGVELYLAEHDLQPGRLLSAKVQHAIERSHCVVVLLTPAAADSAFVQQEIGYAIKCDRAVVCLVDVRLPRMKLGMLEGREFIPLDPDNPDQAIRDAEVYLAKLKDKKEWSDVVVAFVVIGAVVVLMSGRESGGGCRHRRGLGSSCEGLMNAVGVHFWGGLAPRDATLDLSFDE